MSELGRRALTDPLLTLIENTAHEVAAHLRRFWAFWVALAATAAAAAVGMHTGIERLAARWDYPYDHSPLVVGMSVCLLVRALRTTGVERIAPSVVGLFAVLPVTVFYGLAEILDVSLGMHIVLPMVVLAVLAALGGMRLARLAFIPVALLYFTIPIWDLTIPILRRITVSMVSYALTWYGPATYTEGNLITIPSGSFEVAEGCSGMRYFMVSLALAAFIGLWWYSRWRTRILLLAVAGFASMVANWVRIYTLILIGDATNMQHYFIAKSHDGYGWFVYVACMAPVLLFARALDRREPPMAHPSAPAGSPAAVAPAASFLLFGLLASAALASPALIRSGGAVPAAPDEFSLLPAGVTGWRQVEPAGAWKPDFEAPYFDRHESFISSDDVQVDLYVARYLRQRPESKLVAMRNKLNLGWQTRATDSRDITIGEQSRRILQSDLISHGARRLVWQWYIVGGKPTQSRFQAKLYEVLALLRGRRDGAVIAASAACNGDCEAAEAAMARLVESAGPWLETVATGGVDGAN